MGDPDVSYVSEFSQLSFARKEAKMIAEWLGVQPLLGCQATKQAVPVSYTHLTLPTNREV